MLCVGDDGVSCLTHGLYPAVDDVFRFLPSATGQFEGHWQAARIEPRPLAKLAVARDFIGPLADIHADAIVVDIGCGDGVHVQALLESHPHARIAALDYSMAALRTARQVPGDWLALNADASRLPIADNSCDAVISYGVLAYLPDPTRGVAEAVRIARSGGLVGFWIAPPAGGLAGRLFGLARHAVTRLPQVLQRRAADLLVPFLGLMPTSSGLSLRNGSWRECREVILVNIAPATLSFPEPEQVRSWLVGAGCDMIESTVDGNGTYWARKL